MTFARRARFWLYVPIHLCKGSLSSVFLNSSERNNDGDNIDQADFKLIDEIDQKLIELLLKGYTNKKIALEANSPSSTIQRRIRKIFENKYIHKKTELNHKMLRS